MGAPIQIVEFDEHHLEEAYRLALDTWGDELMQATPEQRPFIYRYLVQYYYYPESCFNFAAIVNGELQGFILARSPKERHSMADEMNEQQLDSFTQQLFLNYKAYLDANQAYEDAAARKGDILALLFISRRAGCGKLLLDALQKRAIEQKYTSLLLWTDDTCSCAYYPQHNFQLAAKIPVSFQLFPTIHETLLYRKTLQLI